ncbi:MAG: protein phosphatase 2C domain-containing protein [Muribaculaceae bacterium]|nr:protein phosphatase 2C domain-containing protein [Muribaculaceae bacterium]
MKRHHNISFRLVSYTDAAGKYSPNAFRSGNEDNFFVDEDLTDDTTNRAAQDEILQLGELGMLMVVADGMGGMNAGEVASQIAVDTVRDAFKSANLTESIVASAQTRQKYLEHVIKQADRNIKSESKKDRSKEGMGSTIIMAWLFGDELTISWCGDSRAYIFNEKSGIRLISQDHSYVQELVNKGLLTYDQTFDHPQNNIITRSLGDPTKEAHPESKTLKIGRGDIILLCSDGLSGVLRDRKTYDSHGHPFPEENIEDIIRTHTSSMKECQEALWIAAERGGWYDNVTVILCQITDGPESQWSLTPALSNVSNNKGKKKIGLYVIIGILVICAIIASFFIGKGIHTSKEEGQLPKDEILSDSISEMEAESSSEIDTISEDNKEASTGEQTMEVKDKPSLTEQIKKQGKEKEDTTSNPNGLTKIEKKDKTETKDNSKLTLIKDKKKKEPVENPLNPTNPKKDNITENPLNNQ